jgi:hypothetical protein
VIRAFKLSPFVICTSVSLLVIGELVVGTSLYFTAMMAIAMLSIGVTYNLLGGLSSFSGIIFTFFALCTIVISQFAKVLLLEAADKNLEVPQLTISLYAVFYLSAMVGTFLFGKVRLRLPKPAESLTGAQTSLLYGVSLSVGLVATVIFETYVMTSAHSNYNSAQGAGLAFAPLLLFSLVIAIDNRIKLTGGKHSVDLSVLIPSIALVLFGFFDTSRGGMIRPTVVYFFACYCRGYRLGKRHYLVIASGIVLFFYFIAPLELFTRSFIYDQPLSARIYIVFHTLATHFDPTELRNAASQGYQTEGAAREEYYSRPGTYVLSRLSLIQPDSYLIEACSNGSHYGFASIEIGLLQNIPSFLYKGKRRDTGPADYLEGIVGGGDNPNQLFPTFSAVADSYGAFGWLGVVLVPLFLLPMAFIVYESIFDFSRPWGTVALGILLLSFTETSLTGLLILILRTPLYLVLLSYLVVGLVKMVPIRGERAIGLRPGSPDLGENSL